MNALRAFPAEQQAGLIAQFFADPARADVPRADPRRHPSGRAQHPEHEARRPVSSSRRRPAPAAARGQRHLRPRVSAAAGDPDRARRACPAFALAAASRRRRQPDARHADALGAGRRGGVRLGRRVAVADLRQDAGLARRRVEHAHLRLAAAARGAASATSTSRTRASRRTATSSTRRSASTTRSKHAIGGLAALMPTIDINTQRNSGGIGNAWDFFDIQRVWTRPTAGRWSTGRHTLQAGVEYRPHRARRRVHGAHERRPRLRQLGVLLHRPRRLGRRIRSRSGRHAARLPRPGRRRASCRTTGASAAA